MYSHTIKYMKKFAPIFATMILLLSLDCFAGFFEFGLTGNLRSSRIDKDNYTKTTSLTGSISYYFMEMSALELSYTDGVTEQHVKPLGEAILYTFEFQHYGLDLVFSLASKQSSFQPYIKGGVARVKKTLYSKRDNFPHVKDAGGSVQNLPSLGVGFKFKLTKNLAIKAGIDAWGEKDQNISDWDNAARVGISLFL